MPRGDADVSYDVVIWTSVYVAARRIRIFGKHASAEYYFFKIDCICYLSTVLSKLFSAASTYTHLHGRKRQ